MTVLAIGHAAQAEHPFGESVHAHHMRPIRLGGSCSLDNCVVLCYSCHYNAHEGGRYRDGAVIGAQADYPHFNG